LNIVRDSTNLLALAKELSGWLRGEKRESLRLECMQGLGVYTTTASVSGQLAKWIRRLGPRTRGFPTGQVYDVRVFGLRPAPVKLEDAVIREPSRFVLDLTKALDYDMFRLEVIYHMDRDWLEGLVHHRSSPEPLEELMKYHLSAQLTDPAALNLGFSEVEVEDFPVTARVQIQEEIDTALPVLPLIRRIRQIEGQILSDYDPHHATNIIRLQRERHTLRERIMRKDPAETLRELLLLLRPTRFVTYLKAEEDFRLHDCTWGTDLFEMLGSIAMPKAIEATTRTDLSFDVPTAKGTLTYQSGRFSEDVSAIVEKMRKKESPPKQQGAHG